MAQKDKSTLQSEADAIITTASNSSNYGTTTTGGITGNTHIAIFELVKDWLRDVVDSVLNKTDDIVSQVDAETGTSTTLGIFTPQRISQAIAALAPGGPPVADTGSISFEKVQGNVYGSPETPITGAITFDMTGAVNGGRAILYYKDTTNPLDPLPTATGVVFRKHGGQSWGSDILMRYEFTYQTDTTDDSIIILTDRADNEPPTVSNVALDDGANITVSTTLDLTKTYSQAQSLAEDSARFIMQIWRGDASGDLDIADIEAGTPATLISDTTGVTQWTPQATEETKYIRARVRAYSTDADAPGSDWEYSPVYGPVSAASSNNPLSTSATIVWYDLANNDGGAVGALADHWETVYNKADLSNETDYVNTSTAQQADISGQATDFAALFGGSVRYQAGSWTKTTDLIASGAVRTYYLLFKAPTGQSGWNRLMYIGGGQVYADTSTDQIRVVNGTFQSAADMIDSSGYICLKMNYDGADSSFEVLDGAGRGTAHAKVTLTGNNTFGTVISSTNNHMGLYTGTFSADTVEFRHFVVVDGTITAQEETDLEAWLVAQAAL